MPAIATAAIATAGPRRGSPATGGAVQRRPQPRPPAPADRATDRPHPNAGASATTSSGAAIDRNRTDPSAANVQAAAVEQQERIARPSREPDRDQQEARQEHPERQQLDRPEVGRPPLDDRRREGARDLPVERIGEEPGAVRVHDASPPCRRDRPARSARTARRGHAPQRAPSGSATTAIATTAGEGQDRAAVEVRPQQADQRQRDQPAPVARGAGSAPAPGPSPARTRHRASGPAAPKSAASR